MGTLREYWKNQCREGRERFAEFIASSVAYIDLRYVCGNPSRRQRPSHERMALMIEGSCGEISKHGLAVEFVIEPVEEILKARS